MPVLPSRTIPSGPRLLAVRQDDPSFVPVPSTYGSLGSSPHPGVVAGIVLGSVAGFLLLLWLVYVILHGGRPVVMAADDSGAPMSSVTGGDSSTFASRSVVTLRRERPGKSRRPRSSGSRRTARSKATTARSRERSRRRVSPVIVDPPAAPGRIIVDPPSVTPSPLSSSVPPPHPRFAQESAVSGLSSSDNEIIVEEEHSPSPPRRSYSQRYSQERYRREPLYRDDPRDYPPRDYSPRRESRRYSRDR